MCVCVCVCVILWAWDFLCGQNFSVLSTYNRAAKSKARLANHKSKTPQDWERKQRMNGPIHNPESIPLGWYSNLGKHCWLEKAMAPHSSTLAWKIPQTEEPGRLQSMWSLRVGHNWATSLSLFTFMHGEGNGNPLQCSCLENPRDGGAWWTAIYGVAQSQTRLKWLGSSSSRVSRARD